MAAMIVWLLFLTIASTEYLPRWRNRRPINIKKKAFYENSCQHKRERRFGQNPPISNPHLRDAIKSYEELHNKALLTESTITALHRHVQNERDITNRYLILSTPQHVGLGNRLLPLMSAYLLAMLTDRILLVDFMEYSVRDILCEPFNNSSWTLPETTKWAIINSRLPTGPVNIQNVNPGELVKLAVAKFSEREDDKVYLQTLACAGDLGERLRNVQILHVSSNHYFLPMLFANPAYAEKLKSFFPDGNAASVLARYLFHPRDHIWEDILSTMTKSHEELRVGLQIRSLQGNFSLSLVREAAECLDGLGPSIHIVLASLYPEASQYLYEHRLWNITHRFVDHLQERGKHQAARALHDIWTLSMCEELVTTRRSTMGYMAAILRGRPHMFQAGLESKGYCHQSVSHEPCLHCKFNLEEDLCRGYPESLHLDSRIFMKCEDTKGIKLIVTY